MFLSIIKGLKYFTESVLSTLALHGDRNLNSDILLVNRVRAMERYAGRHSAFWVELRRGWFRYAFWSLRVMGDGFVGK